MILCLFAATFGAWWVGCESPQGGPVDLVNRGLRDGGPHASLFEYEEGSKTLMESKGLSLSTTTCTFTIVGTTMYLDDDCTTDATLFVPSGMVLDGQGNTLTATDPVGGHFLGAVVQNGGAWAGVQNLTVTASGLANVCDPASPVDTRLRGIMYDGAAGFIKNNDLSNITQVGSGCQEGNSIEVRNAPFDGNHPNTLFVDISGNNVSDFMKTGIVANGDVKVSIHDNDVGASANQPYLAANGIQVGFGALGSVKGNNVAGNSWDAASAVATGMLVYQSTAAVVENTINGDSDVGIYHYGVSGAVAKNIVQDDAPAQDGFWGAGDPDYPDYGIGHWGETGGNAHHNYVCGFAVAYEGTIGPKNLSDATCD